MNLSTLLKTNSDSAIEFFRDKNLEEAYNAIDTLRKKAFFDKEACLNLRCDFMDLGLPFDKVNGKIQDMMLLLDQVQIRLVQVKNFYETEQNGYFGNCSVKAPEWYF